QQRAVGQGQGRTGQRSLLNGIKAIGGVRIRVRIDRRILVRVDDPMRIGQVDVGEVICAAGRLVVQRSQRSARGARARGELDQLGLMSRGDNRLVGWGGCR